MSEPRVSLFRPGNWGSGTAADPITVLDAALAQLPVDPHQREVIFRTDSAGCSHDFLDYCVTQGARFILGHRLTADLPVTVTNAVGRRRIPAPAVARRVALHAPRPRAQRSGSHRPDRSVVLSPPLTGPSSRVTERLGLAPGGAGIRSQEARGEFLNVTS